MINIENIVVDRVSEALSPLETEFPDMLIGSMFIEAPG
jgi:hypothetical protein